LTLISLLVRSEKHHIMYITVKKKNSFNSRRIWTLAIQRIVTQKYDQTMADNYINAS